MVVTVHFARLTPIFCRVSWDVHPSTYYASVAAAQLGGCRRAATSRRILDLIGPWICPLEFAPNLSSHLTTPVFNEAKRTIDLLLYVDLCHSS